MSKFIAVICTFLMFVLVVQGKDKGTEQVKVKGQESKLIQNGCFEIRSEVKGKTTFSGWKLIPIEAEAVMTAITQTPQETKSKVAVQIDVKGLSSHGAVLLENNGKDGFIVQKDKEYLLTFYARSEGKINKMDVVIPKLEGSFLAEGKITGLSSQWKKYSMTLKPTENYSKARLVFSVDQCGIFCLDVVKLTQK